MKKLKPIIVGQSREDIHKISDLIEVAGSRPACARWRVAGVDYQWDKGERFVQASARLHIWRIELPEPSKTAAKKAVFEAVRNN